MPRSTTCAADVRDLDAVQAAFDRSRPEIVFHLAAQSLVRPSYLDPIGTWSTNVLGTVNVLEAARTTPQVRAVVVVTTDKVYEDHASATGYAESDPLGGHDPYSASKAACELVADSFRRSFCTGASAPLVATVRAGNVIGGGDWSQDRLLPDLVRSIQLGTPLPVRSPGSIRPWQHVLDCLSGYLMVGERLLGGDAACASAWNIGPDDDDTTSVSDLLDVMRTRWSSVRWESISADPLLHEAEMLRLDTSKATQVLGWLPVWRRDRAIRATADWYRAQLDDGAVLTRVQLDEYLADAARQGRAWVAA